MNKFCPKCGKEISKGTFCNDCSDNTLEFKQIKIKLCPSKKFFYKGSWKDFNNMDELTSRIVKLSLKNAEHLESLDQEILSKTGFKGEINILINYQGEEYYLPVYVEVTYSPDAAKLNTEYFEGILQIRNAKSNHKKFIDDLLIKNKFYVSKKIDLNEGVDYYMLSKKDIDKAVNLILKSLGGYPDKNAQLFSRDRQSSKDIFRINYLVTLPSFDIKDVIEFENNFIYITNLDKKIGGLDLKKNKKTSLPVKKEVMTLKPVKKNWVVVTEVEPEIIVLDPDNYQNVKAKNPFNLKVSPGKKVQIVKKNETYLLK